MEIDADVIALREQFMIPANDDRLQIIHADAVTYLKHNAMQVDVILLDGFDINGLVEELNTSSFYAACDQALNPHGILVANMWGKRKQLVSLLTELRAQFKQRVWWCRSLDSYNLLVFSFKAQAKIFTYSMSAQAEALDQKFSLKFTELSAQMRSLQLSHSSRFNTKEDYEVRELARLTTEMAELMITDEKLASSDVEWSEIHQ